MQRRGGDANASRLEDDDVEVAKGRSHKGEERQKKEIREGWNPVTVLLCVAIFLSICFAWYQYDQATISKAALVQLTASMSLKATENAKLMAGAKHRVEELENFKKTSEETEKQRKQELQKLLEEVTSIKHQLHEERAKGVRLHRDNMDLHKVLKVKASELKLLEEQTHMFEKEMNQLTKSIHGLQGDALKDGEGSDYQALYKKQEEQQKRWKTKQHRSFGSRSAAASVHQKPGVQRSKEALLAQQMAGPDDQADDADDADDGLQDHKHEY